MIGKIAQTSDFNKNLIVNSNTKNYNSNFSESVIKNVNYEFGDIFSDLTTISNYRTGNLNFIALSGKENSDEINGTIINFTLPKNFKEINSIKLIIAINDFEVYTSNISDSVFSKCEILPNTQPAGQMIEQDVDDGDYGIYSSYMYGQNLNVDNDYIKNYINLTNMKMNVDSSTAETNGTLETPNSFRYFYLNENIITIITGKHEHSYSFRKHSHFVDQNHRHGTPFKSHSHQVNTTHSHNISGENLFYKNFNANNINIKEINKNYGISGNTEIDLTNYKSNFTNRITLKPNAKCNLTYFVLLEMYCVENE